MVSIGVKEIADKLTDIVSAKWEAEKVEKEILERSSTHFKRTLMTEFLNLSSLPPRLEVIVNTSELKDLGPLELLPRLHLTISEEAFEWTIIETNGKPEDRLIPE